MIKPLINRIKVHPLFQKLWESRFIPFLIAGGINTLFSYALFALFIYSGLHYALAVLLATCITIVFGFHTTRRAFKQKGYGFLIKFVSIYVFLYFLTLIAINIFYKFIPNYYYAGLFTTLFIPLLSFYLNKTFVFKSAGSR